MRPHAAWIFGSAILAFAYEGWQGTIGDMISHESGAAFKGTIGIVGASLLGWLYNWITTEPDHKKPPVRAKPPRRPKSH